MTTLLTDRQVQQFITDGYVVVKPDLPDDFHRHLFEQTEYVWEKEFNPRQQPPRQDSGLAQAVARPGGRWRADQYRRAELLHAPASALPLQCAGQRRPAAAQRTASSRRGHRTRWLLAFY